MAILVYDLAPVNLLRPVVALLLLAAASGVSYIAYTVIFNLFFHPLRNFPGPKLWAIHYGFYACLELSGNGHRRMIAIHQKYGPVVRVAPNHLAFCHPDAVHDLSGHRKPGQMENLKEAVRYMGNGSSIAGANRRDHYRYRKSMANGFSQQAMVDQQSLISVYIDNLFEKFREFSSMGETFDVLAWFHYATFDIMGDLAFGESFDCVQNSTFHPWITLIIQSSMNMALMASFRRMGFLSNILVALTPKSLLTKLAEHNKLSEQKVYKRLNTDTDRKDFISSMAGKKGKDALSFQEICANASILILGGSETTAAALAAATYYLGLHPESLAKLSNEIRSSFKSEEEIDIISAGHLEYLSAVINESMRLHPPTPGTLPRTIHEEGDTISGHFIPPGTHIDSWYWTAFHFPEYWTQAEEFIPERWLGDPRFENDQRRIFTPFSVGGRGCIGKNLALAEIRLIMARLIWNYDIELAKESVGWDKRCKCYIVFEKGPLNIRLKARK
ncbi:cytochrome P450 [Trichoderma chlorosporum]